MATDKQEKNNNQSKVVDIRQPGKSTPSAFSKPVIVSNKPIIRDPMVSDKQQKKHSEPAISMQRENPQVITPLKENKIKERDSVEDIDKATNSIKEKSADTKTSVTENKPITSESDKGNSNASVVDAVIDQATRENDKKKAEKQLEQERQRNEAEKLINKKKYFVPITEATKRRQTRWIVIFIIFALIAVAYFIVDAQIIKTDMQLPYEFFKETLTSSEPLPLNNR